eukprot:11139181-Alexandrium_andersonii.AAC.1
MCIRDRGRGPPGQRRCAVRRRIAPGRGPAAAARAPPPERGCRATLARGAAGCHWPPGPRAPGGA